MGKILMFKLFIIFLLTCSLFANSEMMLMFESIKKQERNLILQHFKQEKKLRSQLKNKPYFHRSNRKQGNYQNKKDLSFSGGKK